MRKAFSALLIGAAMLLTGCSGEPEKAEQTIFAMDTVMSLTVYGDNADAICANAAHKINELAAKWSVTDERSEIYSANNIGAELSTSYVSDETAELIEYSLDISEQTGGAFDITMYPVLREWGFTTGEYRIPSDERIAELLRKTGSGRVQLNGNILTLKGGAQIDLGGIAKGYTGDILTEYLKSEGAESALLDLGGNIHAIGSKPDGSAWRLGIKAPDGDGNLAVLELRDKAAVTSGGYERYFVGEDGKRYCHILDPETGIPADSGLVSVTIVGEEGRLCDALSTAVYVMGADRAEALWRERGDFEMVLLTDSGELFATAGLRDCIEVISDCDLSFIG